MSIIEKARRKIRGTWVALLKPYPVYKYCYVSYWHSLFVKNKEGDNKLLYLAARPNPGAGIGHQIANWTAGYWFAKRFGLKFAHIPFATEKWEKFLGFGKNEETVSNLLRRGYKVRRIQHFDENNKLEIQRIEKIIMSYAGTKTVFLLEQDQFYQKQYEVIDDISSKFYRAESRKKQHLLYDACHFNIAIHVRRGDIVQNGKHKNLNLTLRYQNNDYFINALETVLEYFGNKKNIHIYLFSQGSEEDFREFNKFSNLHFCFDMKAMESFLHMVYADALITSKSSFSYKPALLNKGVKFCPVNFWHGYPKDERWILLNERGKMLENENNS